MRLLLTRAQREATSGARSDAEEDFGAALTLDPDMAAAYERRAEARYAAGDLGGALRDLQETLKREPRDFPAYTALSRIAEERHDWVGAYNAWSKVMELDPKTPGGVARQTDLKRRAFGEAT